MPSPTNSQSLLQQTDALSRAVNHTAHFILGVAILLSVLLLAHIIGIIVDQIYEWKATKEREEVKERKKKKKSRKPSKKVSKTSKTSKSSKRKGTAASKSTSSSKKKKTPAKTSLKKKEKSKEAPKPLPAPSAVVVVAPSRAGNKPKVGPNSHVTFVNAKEAVPTASKYQIIEAKWPDNPTATPPMPLPVISPLSTRSDASVTSKQLHDSKCPGTDSFGTSPATFTSDTSRRQAVDNILPPSNEALALGTYLRYDMLKDLTGAQPPKIYNPNEVPSPFVTDGVVTARDENESSVHTKTAQSPHSSTIANLESSKSQVSLAPTQSVTKTVDSTQQSTVSLSSTQPSQTPDLKSVASTLSVATTQGSETQPAPTPSKI